MAWWQRMQDVALVFLVQSVLVCVVLCVVRLEISKLWDVNVTIEQASVTIHDSATMLPVVPGVGPLSTIISGSLEWRQPRWLPVWSHVTPSPRSWPAWWWELTLPLWPLPATFFGLAWYARRRVKRLRHDVCTKCGYDTRGLAAGACCPECGAVRSA